MLELRPSCECCDADLPPESGQALICSFEGTFCACCAASKLASSAPTAEASWLPGRAAPSPNSPTIRPRIAAYTSRRAVATRRIEPIEPHALEHQPK